MAQELDQALVVRIEASLRKFERQMDQARKAAVNGAERSEDAWKRGGKRIAANANNASKGLQRLTNISGRGRFVLQNTANQIGDMAVQMEMGTSASRIMSQQLPQLFGGFGALSGALGLVGPLLGAVAALGVPVAAAFLMAGNEGRELNDVVSDMEKALGDMDAVAKVGMMTMDDLTAKYGENAAAVREVYLALVAVNQQQALNAVQETMLAAGEELTDLESKLRDFADARRELLRAQDANADGFAEFLPSEIAAMEDAVQASLERLNEDFGLSAAQAYEVVDALNALQTAKGPEEAAEAVRQISLALSNAAQEGAELDGVFANIAQTAATAYAAFSRAITQGRAAAAELAAVSTAETTLLPGVYSPDGGVALPPRIKPDKKNGKTKSSGGGGAAKIPAGLREAEALYRSTRSQAENYASEVERINELHRLFPEIVTTEVRDRALSALQDGVDGISGAAKTLEQSFADTFASIISGAEDAKSALAGLLSQLANVLAQSAVSGLVGSLNIPGFATGTNFAPGGLAKVGERGPEIVNLPRGSQVINANKTKRMLSGGGGGVSISIDARGAEIGAAERIRAEVQAMLPDITRASVGAVAKARKRGFAV